MPEDCTKGAEQTAPDMAQALRMTVQFARFMQVLQPVMSAVTRDVRRALRDGDALPNYLGLAFLDVASRLQINGAAARLILEDDGSREALGIDRELADSLIIEPRLVPPQVAEAVFFLLAENAEPGRIAIKVTEGVHVDFPGVTERGKELLMASGDIGAFTHEDARLVMIEFLAPGLVFHARSTLRIVNQEVSQDPIWFNRKSEEIMTLSRLAQEAAREIDQSQILPVLVRAAQARRARRGARPLH